MLSRSVLLADRHLSMLEGVRDLLRERFEAVIMVADERSLLRALEKCDPDCAIVDVSLPHAAGRNIIASLHDRFAELNLLALSSHADRTLADRMLASGAQAVVLKSSAVNDLGPALDAMATGGRYVSPKMSPETGGGFLLIPN